MTTFRVTPPAELKQNPNSSVKLIYRSIRDAGSITPEGTTVTVEARWYRQTIGITVTRSDRPDQQELITLWLEEFEGVAAAVQRELGGLFGPGNGVRGR